MADLHPPYLTIRSLSSSDRNSLTSTDSAVGASSSTGVPGATSMAMDLRADTSKYGSANSDFVVPSTTHDTSRVNYHVKHLDSFARTLEDSASRAFPNRGRSRQRYTKVMALLVHWKSDDLFVLPELEDLEKCMREDYGFETDTFPIPSENAHLELMMRIGAMIKDHESPDTLFVVYYGGHARIDESRQSTWCATRNPNSPWLQWSAIQTLLERSTSDTLILLDCCAGAASATFPNGKSITETISASSWDAIAPDPGRYSFTNALIEVLQEWRLRTFSAAMLHAEVLARLKHPRPILINGKMFEARSTPVHFMMTANHRAPSIEIGRMLPRNRQLPSPPMEPDYDQYAPGPSGGRGPVQPINDPNEDEPHVMISLALEDDQNLDLNAWEQWLSSFPALAKYVKVQGVFKSHSTLLLLSLPVMVWDLLPENRACSFVAFIRSNNLLKETQAAVTESAAGTADVPAPGQDVSEPDPAPEDTRDDVDSGSVGEQSDIDTGSIFTGTTWHPEPSSVRDPSIRMSIASTAVASVRDMATHRPPPLQPLLRSATTTSTQRQYLRNPATEVIPRPKPGGTSQRSLSQHSLKNPVHSYSQEPVTAGPVVRRFNSNVSLSRTMILNQQRGARRTILESPGDLSDGPRLSQHVVDRLEEYFQQEPNPSVGITEFFASNLGVEKRDIDLWFHRRREQELMTRNLQSLTMGDYPGSDTGDDGGTKMILPGDLNKLLDIFPPSQLLFVDLRSPMDFEKTHIYGAVNLRVPVSFVEHGFDLLDKAFTDDQSRRNFMRAPTARCMVFYDRVIESAWECPMADVLVEQLREKKQWGGDSYILKGHFREFSASFDKYITGDKMTQAAKDYVDSLRQRAPPIPNEIQEIEERYTEWKAVVEHENRMLLADSPANQDERRQAVQQHQEELEAQLEARNPVLYRKAMGLRQTPIPKGPSSGVVYDLVKRDPDAKYPVKEPRPDLVGPLTRGLEKIHSETSFQTTPNYDKLAEYGEASSMPSVSDDFDEIDPQDEQLHEDPAFLKAGHRGGSGDLTMGRGGASNNEAKRGRERWPWKRLKANK